MAIGDIINTSTLTTTFDDEFNSFVSSPDGSTGMWRTTLLNGDRTLGSNGEQEYYSDSSVGVSPFSDSNGVLTIQAAPGRNALGLPYNSGVITTENSFNQLYGYFEIDAKMPAGQGLWPAFWLLPASGAWPPELDVLEVLGNNPTTLYFSTHSGVQATQGTALNVANVSSGFNLYGVMWGPKTVDLYINNIEVASMPTPADMNVPMYMLANLAVGGYWPGDPNGSTVFPAKMQIDYVRAFAYPGTTGGKVYDTTPSQNSGPAPLAPVISAPASLAATTGAASAVTGISLNSNWPGGFFTVVISDTSGLLDTSATADVFTSGEDTRILTLTGNLAPINAALASLTYQGAAAGSEWIWVSATDPQGLQNSSHIVATDSAGGGGGSAPTVTAPATLTVAPGSAQPLTGISVADRSSQGNFSVAVSDTAGILSAPPSAGLTLRGDNSASLTLTGNLAAVNAGLASLYYTAGAATGTDWIWVTADNAAGQQGVGHEVVTVAGTVGSAVPVVTTAAALSISAGATKAVAGVSVSQASGPPFVTVSDSAGLLNVALASGLNVRGEDSTSLSLQGSQAVIDKALSSLTYTAGAKPGADWLWVSANVAGGQQGLSHEVVTVTGKAPHNTAPVVTTPSTLSLWAGATKALPGVGVNDGQAAGVFRVTVSDSIGLIKAASAGGVTVTGEGSRSLTLQGSLVNINKDLTSLTYTAGASPATDWLWVSANNLNGQMGLSHEVVTATAPLAVQRAAAFEPFATCFCSGTRIATVAGEIPVEALEIGDEVLTAHGAPKRVKWIGMRSYDGRFIAGSLLLLPICINASAIAPGIPSQDLFVSPGHAIQLGGALVPAWRLLNGVTITQASEVESVTYFHIELEGHDVIFAENCPAESFVDDGCRQQFENAAAYEEENPEDQPRPGLQRTESGFLLESVARRLAARAGVERPARGEGDVIGFVDQAASSALCGWACYKNSNPAPVCLDVLVDGRRSARVLANQFRADLHAAGYGDGCHGFELKLPAGGAGQIAVRGSVSRVPLAFTEEALARAA